MSSTSAGEVKTVKQRIDKRRRRTEGQRTYYYYDKNSQLIKGFYHIADIQERQGDLLGALSTYDRALNVAKEVGAFDEIPFLACTCSRVSFRIKHYNRSCYYADICIFNDPTYVESQVRLGRALDGNGLFHEALTVFLTAIRSSSISSDKSKMVMYFCSSAVKIQTKDLRFPEEIFAFTTPRIWTDAAYGLITEGNWEASQFAFGRTLFMPVEDTKIYSLRPFYNLKLLTPNSWAMEFLGRLVENGSVLSSLADGTDESFLHAYFRMILVTGRYISEALNPYVKQEIDSNESLMFDSEGNTLFHLIVKEGAHNPGIQMFLCQEMITMGLSKYLGHRDRADRTTLSYVHGNDYGLQLLFHQNVPGDLKDDEISIQEEASETMSSLTVEKGKKLIKECKELGELQEKGGDLSSAFTTYDEALSVASETGSIEDIPCLACTCSRLSFLLKHYSESLHYADICVMHDPNKAEVKY
ncbi:hypothetical protein FSP39_008682 [Pinctada imbricata]|uniref:Uncharacterized protein n=1 Tax=Pinctada imbricata TaxID=66713 RepID=A0AA88XLI5_PINIB|nr:hypothetical protein FSP39_008682 [Pinctada imbricata]